MTWVGVLALAFASLARPNGKNDIESPNVYAVRAGWIYTLSSTGEVPPFLRDGIMIVRDGRIEALGSDIEVPPGIPVLEFSDSVVVPGLVLADTGMVNARGGKETVSARYRAIDGFDMYANRSLSLSCGVTTVFLNPGKNRLVSGTGSVVKLAGSTVEKRLLKRIGELCINLGEGAFKTPPLQEYPLPAYSQNKIPPSVPQRPGSRLSQCIEIRESFEKALEYRKEGAGAAHKFDINLDSLGAMLETDPLLRIDARHAADIEGGLRLIDELQMDGYITGALECHISIDAVRDAHVPVVLEVPLPMNRPGQDKGYKQDTVDVRFDTAAKLSDSGVRFAIVPPAANSAGDVLMAAAAAVRGGLCPMKAMEAITRVPAEILGVADRVGSLDPGKDADFAVLSGKPLMVNTHVMKVFSSGEEVFTHPQSTSSLVICAGRILTGAGPELLNAELLLEDGKISAVGRSVPRPPGAKVVNAGPDAVVTPGFIDGHGHLGLEGDRTAPSAGISPADAVAVPGPRFAEVAGAGVTTVVLAPYTTSSKGVPVSAIKTCALERGGLIVDDLAAVKFSFRNKDPVLGVDSLRSSLKAGKTYADSWTKYHEALKKWEEEQAKKREAADKPGSAVQGEKGKDGGKEKEKEKENIREEKVEEIADPITGTWEYEVTGDQLPAPQSGALKLSLSGNSISGTVQIFFRGDEEVPVQGTLEGKTVRMEVDVQTPIGKPVIEAELDREDHMQGTLSLGQMMSLQLTADRTEKEAPRTKVVFRKKTAKDGRPEPPPLNEAYEPYRAMFAGRVPALVEVSTAPEIEQVLKLFVDEYKVRLGLLGAEEAYKRAGIIKKAEAGVVVPPAVLSTREGKQYVLADELARKGVTVIFQSDAADGARTLPLMAAYFVRMGMSAEHALLALTKNPASLYGIDDRVGSIEAGKDADIIIFSGDPFEVQSRVMRVFVSGREVKR